MYKNQTGTVNLKLQKTEAITTAETRKEDNDSGVNFTV